MTTSWVETLDGVVEFVRIGVAVTWAARSGEATSTDNVRSTNRPGNRYFARFMASFLISSCDDDSGYAATAINLKREVGGCAMHGKVARQAQMKGGQA